MTELQRKIIATRAFEKTLKTVVKDYQGQLERLAEKWNNEEGYDTLEEAKQVCFKMIDALQKSNTFTMKFAFNGNRILVYPEYWTAHPDYRVIYTGLFTIDINGNIDGYTIKCEWLPGFRVLKEDTQQIKHAGL